MVQQALREVLWGDLVATGLPKHLRKDVEGVRELEGQFLVNGVKVEFRKMGGGELSVEEWKKLHEKFGRMPYLPKVGEVLDMKRWELRSTSLGIMIWKLGRNSKKATFKGKVYRWVEEVMVEQGGLVNNSMGMKKDVRGDGEGGILLHHILPGRKGHPEDPELEVSYMTRRI